VKTVCQKCCSEILELSEKLIKLSQSGQIVCDDTSCLVFFGIVLDSASKMRLEAKKRLDEIKRPKGHSTFQGA
jgi:hypothetical protein